MWAPPATAARTSGLDNIAVLIKAKLIDNPAYLGGKTYEPGDINFTKGVVSGTEATQYGIKFFNLQEPILLYRIHEIFGIYKKGVNPVNLVNPVILSQT